MPAGVPPLPPTVGADYLVAENLEKAFSRGESALVAVGDVSFSVERGSFLTVVGPSGCGKSTLLQMVAGLMGPTRGAVHLDGSLVDSPPFEMIYLFQQYTTSLMPWRTVLENVTFGLEVPRRRAGRSTREIARLAREQLARVGLEGTEQQYPAQLSGGMQQRVAIARALVCQPSVLLMDEPFSALDALSRASLQDLVLQLWSDLELTIVFVTHDIEEAVYLSDSVAVLSTSPSTIIDRLEIDLPRPRHQVSTRESEAFLGYRRELYAKVVKD